MKSRSLLIKLADLSLLTLLFICLLAQAMGSHGPEGGEGVLALDPLESNMLYRRGNGIHKSIDGGETWRRIEGPMNFSFIDIRINPMNPNIMYVWGRINGTWGLYKSTDGANNWNLVLRDAYWFDIDPRNPETLYVIKPGEGILKTTNGGDKWELKLADGVLNSIAVHRVETNTIYVGGNGVHKSTDGGENWIVVGLDGIFISPIFLDPVDVNALYGQVAYPMMGDRMAKSTDGGVNWERLPSDLRGPMAIDQKDTRVLYMGVWELPDQRGMYKSTDGGESWRQVGGFYPSDNVVIDPTNTRTVYVGSYAGIAKSTDAGESWKIHRRGFVATGVFIVIVAPSDQSRIYGQAWRSIDGGESWSELGPGANARAIDPSNPDTLYGVGQGLLKKSTDAGDSWVTILSESILDTFAIDPNDANTLYAAGRCNPTPCDIFKSTDAGMNWTRVASLPQVFSFAIDPTDGQILYAGTRSGVYKSTDGGEHWNPSGLGALYVAWITIDENNPTTLYAGAGGGIYKSEDGAGSWSRLSDLNVNPVVIDPRDPNILYAGNPSGVFKSIDGGKTWEPRNQGLTNTSINHLAIAGDTGRLYAATGGAGVWFSDDGAETWE